MLYSPPFSVFPPLSFSFSLGTPSPSPLSSRQSFLGLCESFFSLFPPPVSRSCQRSSSLPELGKLVPPPTFPFVCLLICRLPQRKPNSANFIVFMSPQPSLLSEIPQKLVPPPPSPILPRGGGHHTPFLYFLLRSQVRATSFPSFPFPERSRPFSLLRSFPLGSPNIFFLTQCPVEGSHISF